MTTKIYQMMFIALAGVTLAACATPPQSSAKVRGIAAFADDPRLGKQVSKICFNRTIDGFYNATRDTVVLSRGASEDYIVEVKGVCSNLRNARSVAIDSQLSCVTRGDVLLVSTSTFTLNDGTGMGPDRCYIEKIHQWDKSAKSTTTKP